MDQVQKMFQGLPSEDKQIADVFNEKKPEEQTTQEDTEEVKPEGRENRRERRLKEQLQHERESNIALNERIKVLSEVEQFKRENTDDSIDSDLVQVFGNTEIGLDNAKKVASIFQKKIDDVARQAEERALERIEQSQRKADDEQREYEDLIDSKLEGIEDEYDVDLTSNSPKANKTRKEFLTLLESLSPKDDNGTVTSYADFGSTFKVYIDSKKQKPDNSVREEIANKTMQHSNATNNSKAEDDATRAYLKSIGIRL